VAEGPATPANVACSSVDEPLNAQALRSGTASAASAVMPSSRIAPTICARSSRRHPIPVPSRTAGSLPAPC